MSSYFWYMSLIVWHLHESTRRWPIQHPRVCSTLHYIDGASRCRPLIHNYSLSTVPFGSQYCLHNWIGNDDNGHLSTHWAFRLLYASMHARTHARTLWVSIIPYGIIITLWVSISLHCVQYVTTSWKFILRQYRCVYCAVGVYITALWVSTLLHYECLHYCTMSVYIIALWMSTLLHYEYLHYCTVAVYITAIWPSTLLHYECLHYCTIAICITAHYCTITTS